MIDIGLFEKFARDIRKGFKPHTNIKVNRKEVELLTFLEREKNRPMHFYGRHIGLERGSFTYLTDLLVEKGLIDKIEDETDKRCKSLKLTEKGHDLVDELKVEFDEYMKERLSELTPKEFEDLELAYKIIERIDNKLKKDEKKPKHIEGKHFD